MAPLLTCPLCSQPGFQTLDSLRHGLISAATREVVCPVCHDVLSGLDKFTIHLFSHSMQQQHQLDTSAFHKPTPVSHQTNRLLICDQTYFSTKNLHIREVAAPLKTHVTLLPADVVPQNVNSYNKATTEHLPSRVEVQVPHDARSNFPVEGAEIKKNQKQAVELCKNRKTAGYSPYHFNAGQQRVTHQTVSVQCPSSSPPQTVSVQCPPPSLQQTVSVQCPSSSPPQTVSVQCPSSSPPQTVSVQCPPPSSQQTVSVQCPSSSPQQTISVQNPPTSQQTVSVQCPSSSSSPQQTVSVQCQSSSPHQTMSVQNPPPSQQTVSVQCPSSSPQHTVSVECPSSPQQKVTVQFPSSSPQLVSTNSTQKKTDKSVKCGVCGFSFDDDSILAIHKQLVHPVQTFTSANSNSSEQVGKIGNDERSQFPCHMCSKVFKMRGSLMVHLRVAHSTSILGKSLSGKAEAADTEERKYGCHLCTKSFRKEQHLAQHVKTHEGKQWECETCCKLFTTKYFLKKHRRLHTGETPYSCEHCGKTFTFQQSYHKHLLYHSDDKPHVCTECDRAFKELSTLHNHQRIHTGEKPFACETCGKCFRQRVSYLVHRRIHTGAMPYQCTACRKRFRYKVSQRTHKCPVQPPGTVVRQPEEFAQKEDPGSQANRGNSETVSAQKAAAVTVTNHQIPAAHQQFNNNQFTIIMDNNAVSVIPTSQMVVTSTGLFTLNQGDDRNACEALNMKVSSTETASQSNGAKISKLSTEGVPVTSSSVIDKDHGEFAHKKCSKKGSTDTGFTLEEHSGSPELWRSTVRTPKPQDLSVETTDFFTMVMSPSLRNLPSPSERLKHLTLSSPSDTLLTYEDGGMYQFLLNPEEGAKNSSEPSPRKSPKHNSENVATDSVSLQTINEESFKQLLYGGSRP